MSRILIFQCGYSKVCFRRSIKRLWKSFNFSRSYIPQLVCLRVESPSRLKPTFWVSCDSWTDCLTSPHLRLQWVMAIGNFASLSFFVLNGLGGMVFFLVCFSFHCSQMYPTEALKSKPVCLSSQGLCCSIQEHLKTWTETMNKEKQSYLVPKTKVKHQDVPNTSKHWRKWDEEGKN